MDNLGGIQTSSREESTSIWRKWFFKICKIYLPGGSPDEMRVASRPQGLAVHKLTVETKH
jgi:hypothetical protein